MGTKKTHINDFEIGDKIYMPHLDSVVVVTDTEITGFGWQRLFGYDVNCPEVPYMVAGCDGEYDKVIEVA